MNSGPVQSPADFDDFLTQTLLIQHMQKSSCGAALQTSTCTAVASWAKTVFAEVDEYKLCCELVCETRGSEYLMMSNVYTG